MVSQRLTRVRVAACRTANLLVSCCGAVAQSVVQIGAVGVGAVSLHNSSTVCTQRCAHYEMVVAHWVERGTKSLNVVNEYKDL